MPEIAELLEPHLDYHYRGHKAPVICSSFNPNFKQAATGSADASLMVWNFRQSSRAYRFLGHKDRTVRLWIPSVKGESTVFKAHIGAVRSVNFSHDSEQMITSSDDKTVKLWTVNRQQFIASLIGHKNWVRSARFSPDARMALSGGDDKVVKLWDCRTRQPIAEYYESRGQINQVKFHPSGNSIAAAGDDCSARIWDLRTHKLLQHYTVHSGPVTALSFHPSGKWLVTSGTDGALKILDIMEGHLVFTLHGHEEDVNTVNFSNNGDQLISGGNDKQVIIWKTNFDEQETDKTAKQASKSKSPKKKTKSALEERISADIGPVYGEPDKTRGMKENSHIVEQLEERNEIQPQLERTMRQMIQQMDVLTNTVSILEQRLTMMEGKMTDVMLDQNIRRLTDTDFVADMNEPVEKPTTPRDPLFDTINTSIQ